MLKCIVNITPQESATPTEAGHKIHKGQLAPIKLVEEDVKVIIYRFCFVSVVSVIF